MRRSESDWRHLRSGSSSWSGQGVSVVASLPRGAPRCGIGGDAHCGRGGAAEWATFVRRVRVSAAGGVDDTLGLSNSIHGFYDAVAPTLSEALVLRGLALEDGKLGAIALLASSLALKFEMELDCYDTDAGGLLRRYAARPRRRVIAF